MFCPTPILTIRATHLLLLLLSLLHLLLLTPFPPPLSHLPETIQPTSAPKLLHPLHTSSFLSSSPSVPPSTSLPPGTPTSNIVAGTSRLVQPLASFSLWRAFGGIMLHCGAVRVGVGALGQSTKPFGSVLGCRDTVKVTCISGVMRM